VSARTFQDP